MCCCADKCVWGCIIAAVAFVYLIGLAVIIIAIVAQQLVFAILAGVVIIVAVICTIIVYCCRERISLAVAIIAEAAHAIKKMPLLPFLSGIASICTAILSVLMFLGLIFFLSHYDFAPITVSGETTTTETTTTETTTTEFTTPVPNISTFGAIVILVISFIYLWIEMFITGVNQTTIGGAVTTWYFMQDKDELPSFPIMRAFGRTFRYHSGAISFGSLVVVVVKVLVALCDMARSDLKEGNDGGIVGAILLLILACLQCLLQHLEKYLEFLNARTYILMTIKGGGFYHSAKETLFLLLRNLLRATV